MKALPFTLASAAVLALSACGGARDEANPGPEAEEQFDGMASGKWEVSSRMTGMDLDSIEAAGDERASELLNEERTGTICLELSQRSSPPPAMFYPGSEACTVVSLSMVKGRISGSLKCTSDGDEPTRLSGSYDKQSFSVSLTKTLPGGEERSRQRTFSTSGRRKGNC